MRSTDFPRPLSAWSVTQLSGGRTQRVPELEWPVQCVLGGDFNTGRLLLFSVQSDEELCVWKRSLEKEKPEWAGFSCWFGLPRCVGQPQCCSEASFPFCVREIGERKGRPRAFSVLWFHGPLPPWGMQLRPADNWFWPGQPPAVKWGQKLGPEWDTFFLLLEGSCGKQAGLLQLLSASPMRPDVRAASVQRNRRGWGGACSTAVPWDGCWKGRRL